MPIQLGLNDKARIVVFCPPFSRKPDNYALSIEKAQIVIVSADNGTPKVMRGKDFPRENNRDVCAGSNRKLNVFLIRLATGESQMVIRNCPRRAVRKHATQNFRIIVKLDMREMCENGFALILDGFPLNIRSEIEPHGGDFPLAISLSLQSRNIPKQLRHEGIAILEKGASLSDARRLCALISPMPRSV